MLSKPKKLRFPAGISAKAKGDLAEAIFVFRAEALGFQVSKPLTETDRFDFHVQSRSGTFRVQVKSAWKIPRYHYLVGFTRGAALNPSSGYDTLVVYIAPLDAWYIIPASAIESRWLLLYPHRPNKGKYEKYLEGWRTLTGDVPGEVPMIGLEIHAARES